MEDTHVVQFWADGAVHLPSVLDQSVIKLLEEGVEKSKEQQSEYGETLQHDGDTGSFFNDYFQWRDIPEYKKVIEESQLASMAAALMKSQKACFYHDHTLVKEAGVTTGTPWHHDQA